MIDILLAAYNGERYLPDLLRSLRAQRGSDLRVLCRDDGSQDGSPALLESAAREDGRFHLVSGAPTGSPSGCFFELLAASDAPYAMFCDQDDWWHPDKVERTLEAMQATEAQLPPDTPVLVHTDLAVTDGSRRILAPSMMAMQGLHPEEQGLSRLLCQSLVTGCTLMVNAPLRALILSHTHEGALMHDWWLSLAAAAFGRLVYLDAATIDYRQHGGNQIGAKSVHSPAYLLARLRSGAENRDALRDTCRQAAAFAAAFAAELTAQQSALVRGYAALPELPPLRRRAELLRLGTLKCGSLRRLGQFWYI